MDNLCTVCLSKDRQLYKLGNLRSVYDCLVPDYEPNLSEVTLCWECCSVLRRCHQFQKNAVSARNILISYTFNATVDTFGFLTGEIETTALSTLAQSHKADIDYIYTFDDSPTYHELSIKPESTTIKYIDVEDEKKLATPEVKTEMLPDENEIDNPMTPCASVNDPLSDVTDKIDDLIPPPEFTAVDVKPLPETNRDVPIILSSGELVKPLPKGLIPLKDMPGPSKGKTLKKIKIPQHVAKQIQMLAAQNKPLQLKVGNIDFKNIVVMKQGAAPEVKKAEPIKKVKKKLIKLKPKTAARGELLKRVLKKKYVTDVPKKPTSEQIFQRFSNMLRTTLPEEFRKNVRVRVMTEKEVAQYREELRQEPQFVNSQYKCRSCVMGYYSEQQLEDHNIAKHTEKPVDVKCDVCLAYIPSYMFTFHYGRHRVLYSCLLCDHDMSEPKRVKEHMSMHKKPDPPSGTYNCNVCGTEFSSRHRCKVHKEKEHAPQENYTCEICGKTFDRRWSWKDHVKRHNIPNEPVECHVCHKQYKNSVSFSMHYRNVHNRDASEKVRCEECDISFVNLQCLNMHLKYSRKHADPSNFKHICYACGKGFMFERQMKDHINYVHKGQTEHVCKYCNKMYSSAGGLRKHIKFVHEGGTYEKNKVCTVCGKSFTQTAALRQHMNIHSGVRPYQCKVCAASFKNHGALYTHYKLKHLKLKKEDKVKIRNLGVEGQQSIKTLRDHQNIHNGTRPYKCVSCGDSFKQSAALYTHNRLVHLGFKMRGKKVVKTD